MNHLVKSNLDELLADVGVIDAVSWRAPQAMTYEQWADVGRKFQRVSGAVNWWLGDWLNEGERRYGDTYTQAIEVTGNRLEQLKNCAWVAGRVQKSTRVDGLTWTHHRHVAHLDEPAQKALLTYAAQKELSSRDLLEAVRDYERNLSQEAQPMIVQTYPGETLTAIDDGGTQHRANGVDPHYGVCVAEADCDEIPFTFPPDPIDAAAEDDTAFDVAERIVAKWGPLFAKEVAEEITRWGEWQDVGA